MGGSDMALAGACDRRLACLMDDCALDVWQTLGLMRRDDDNDDAD